MSLSSETKALTQDRWFAALVLGVVALSYWQTLGFASSYGLSDLSHPATYPRLLLLGLLLLATLVVIRPRQGAADHQSSDLRSRAARARDRHGKPALVVLTFALYLLVLEPLGFVMASIAFLLVAQLILMQIRTIKLLVVVVVVSTALPLGLQYVFTDLLRIFLP